MRPYKTSNLKFPAKLGICKYIHVLASRNIAFSCNIAAKVIGLYIRNLAGFAKQILKSLVGPRA